MTKRIAATLLSLGVAGVTVASAWSLEAGAESGRVAAEAAPQDAAAVKGPGGTTTVTTEVTVVKAPGGQKAAEPEVRVLRAPPPPKPAAANRAAAVAKARVARDMQAIAVPAGQVQQYLQQFRPILRSEYHVVRAICRLTPEQRKPMARAGEKALRDAARNYVEMMRRPMTAAQRTALDPRRQIREGLSRAVQAQLPADLAARYNEEIARREGARKQLAVRNLVVRLDRDLALSAEQRDKIGESLSAHWDDSWCQSLEMFMYDYQFLPPIGDQYVAPFLNDSQKKIWRGIQKIQTFWGGFGIMGGVRVDDPLEDEELRQARLEADRNEPAAPNQGGGMMGGAVMKMQVLQPAQPAQLKVIRKKAEPSAKAEAKTSSGTRTRKEAGN